MCCVRLAGNTGRKNDAKNRHLRTIAQLCRTISSHLRHHNRQKNMLNSNISSTCSHNMVNFGLPAAGIISLVWGTPANVNGFGILASLVQRSPEANQTLHDIWPSPGLVRYVYILGAFVPLGNFARCKIHFASKSCVVTVKAKFHYAS